MKCVQKNFKKKLKKGKWWGGKDTIYASRMPLGMSKPTPADPFLWENESDTAKISEPVCTVFVPTGHTAQIDRCWRQLLNMFFSLLKLIQDLCNFKWYILMKNK